MRYVVYSLGLLVLATSAATIAIAEAAPVTSSYTVSAEKKISTPQKHQKVGFFQKVGRFFSALYEKATSGWAPFSLILLAIFAPTLAVGIATNWDPDQVLINMLLTALCFIPGIIHAIVQASKYRG